VTITTACSAVRSRETLIYVHCSTTVYNNKRQRYRRESPSPCRCLLRPSDRLISFPTACHTCKSVRPFHYGRVCTESVVKICVNMHQFRKLFQECLLNIQTNYFAAGSCWSEQHCSSVLSFKSGKSDFSRFFTFSTTQMRGKGRSWEVIF